MPRMLVAVIRHGDRSPCFAASPRELPFWSSQTLSPPGHSPLNRLTTKGRHEMRTLGENLRTRYPGVKVSKARSTKYTRTVESCEELCGALLGGAGEGAGSGGVLLEGGCDGASSGGEREGRGEGKGGKGGGGSKSGEYGSREMGGEGSSGLHGEGRIVGGGWDGKGDKRGGERDDGSGGERDDGKGGERGDGLHGKRRKMDGNCEANYDVKECGVVNKNVCADVNDNIIADGFTRHPIDSRERDPVLDPWQASAEYRNKVSKFYLKLDMSSSAREKEVLMSLIPELRENRHEFSWIACSDLFVARRAHPNAPALPTEIEQVRGAVLRETTREFVSLYSVLELRDMAMGELVRTIREDLNSTAFSSYDDPPILSIYMCHDMNLLPLAMHLNLIPEEALKDFDFDKVWPKYSQCILFEQNQDHVQVLVTDNLGVSFKTCKQFREI